MAQITTNTAGTAPAIIVTSNVSVTGSTFTPNFNPTNDIIVPYIQNLTINQATGIFSYNTFSCDGLVMQKITTPADNGVSTNVVLDDATWFGNGTPTANIAISQGLDYLSRTATRVGIKAYIDDCDGVGTGKRYYQGTGYITSVAPTTSPDQPIWVSPIEIAIDGAWTVAQNP